MLCAPRLRPYRGHPATPSHFGHTEASLSVAGTNSADSKNVMVKKLRGWRRPSRSSSPSWRSSERRWQTGPRPRPVSRTSLQELVKKALAEEGKVDDEPLTWSADAATNVIRSMAAKPGIPPEVAALLEQVQLAVAAMAAAAAPVQGGSAQQQLPQHQQKHQGAELGASADKGGTTTGGGGPTPAAGPATAAPSFLGPQGRWAKGPLATGTVANHGGATVGSTGAAGTDDATTTAAATATPATTTAAAAAAGAPAAPTPRVPAAAESEEELVEETGDADVQMDGDVETSISKLPKEVQAKLRRALKSRGGIRRGDRGGDADEGRSRDRERSPRLAKKGGNEDDGQGEI